eukprot:3021339-Rhodomonas_salina.1
MEGCAGSSLGMRQHLLDCREVDCLARERVIWFLVVAQPERLRASFSGKRDVSHRMVSTSQSLHHLYISQHAAVGNHRN